MASSVVPKDDAERKVLEVLRTIEQKQGPMMNVPTVDGRMLRLLAETIGAKNVVEIGTSNGVSAIWLGLALRKTGGKLVTHEIDAERAALRGRTSLWPGSRTSFPWSKATPIRR